MRALSLFSGVGMMDYGLEMTGHFKTVAFCEIEEWPRRVLDKHWPDVPKYTDVRELNRERIEADGVGSIDVITGGFPCTDISVAGGQAGIDGDESGLWSEFARLIGELRCTYAIVENSSALTSGDNGQWLGRVLGDLAEIGYDAEWHCIPASVTGAPHVRDRVWIVAYPERQRQQGQGQLVTSLYSAPGAYREAGGLVHAVREDALPYLCRGHDGPAGKLDKDRLTALGNGLCWPIPYAIGKAIHEREGANP